MYVCMYLSTCILRRYACIYLCVCACACACVCVCVFQVESFTPAVTNNSLWRSLTTVPAVNSWNYFFWRSFTIMLTFLHLQLQGSLRRYCFQSPCLVQRSHIYKAVRIPALYGQFSAPTLYGQLRLPVLYGQFTASTLYGQFNVPSL